MATFLDVTLLGGAKVIFTFLLIYMIVWGVLVLVKPFGKSTGTGPYAIIALVAAFFGVLSKTMRYLIEFVTPWFLFMIIFLFFVLLLIRMFNLGEGDMVTIIKQPPVYIMIIAIVVLIMIFGLGSAFGQSALEATQGGTQGTVYYQGEGAYDNVVSEDGTSGSSGVLQPVDTTLEPGDDLNYVSTTGYNGQPQPGTPGATATSSFSLNLINTLLHPKVMAIIVIILVGTITVWLLGRQQFI